MTSTPTEATAVRNVLISSISPEVWPAHDSCKFKNPFCVRWKTEGYLMRHGQDARNAVVKREDAVSVVQHCCQKDLPAALRDASHVW